MPRPVSKSPTDAELQVLQIIWRAGPSTLRQIQEALPGELTRASVFSRLEAMVAKGQLRIDHRSKGEGGSIYVAAQTREGVVSRMFRQLSGMFGNSPRSLIQGLLREGELDQSELDELRAMLRENDMKGRSK